MKRLWIISAKNTAGEWLYYCESATQGNRMVPNADSLACRFSPLSKARVKAVFLEEEYPRLKHWVIYEATANG